MPLKLFTEERAVVIFMYWFGNENAVSAVAQNRRCHPRRPFPDRHVKTKQNKEVNEVKLDTRDALLDCLFNLARYVNNPKVLHACLLSILMGRTVYPGRRQLF